MSQYNITGMSCAACSTRIEKAVAKVDGVDSCSVSLLTNSMSVEGEASPDNIISAVEKAGYGAKLKNNNNDSFFQNQTAESDMLNDRETPKIKKRVAISTILLIVLMYISMGHMMWSLPLPSYLDGNHIAIGLIQLILTAIIMVVNQKFFISGFNGLIHRAPNMDTLVALGSGAAFVYSTYALFAMTDAQLKGSADAVTSYMHEFYFESSAMILTLITIGKMLEARSKGKTTDALKGLMKLAPKNATVIRNDKETTIPIEQVNSGDIFAVRPGESIPVDGVVIGGSSAVNEAAITGESIPVDKEAGDRVSSATINQSGYIKCRATRVGQDTTLSQIIKMVSDAAATKAPIAKIADKVSGVFVPIVIVIALITTMGWLIAGQGIGFALARGISVLVISCPCALGLATPVAIMVGNGKGAKNGILFKTAVSLEEAGKTQIVALDKTGTITSGEPRVTDIIPAKSIREEELLDIAIALEAKSEHPLAKAIMQKADEINAKPIEAVDFKAVAGNGLTARLGDDRLAGGSYKFISSQSKIPQELKNNSEVLARSGKTPLFFSKNGELIGIIAVADVIKNDSPQAIKELQNMGIRVVMLTGDNERTANAIGKEAGVDSVIAGVLPEGKEAVIRSLKEYGKVAMVGDGINDAPALTSADIGIAIGAGTDIAIDAADIVLMKSRLSDVPAAIRLSRAVLTNIRENLFWAFIYNIIGIPLATGILTSAFNWQLNPMFAAAAMSLSSFCVISNALRLNLFKLYETKKDKKIKQIDLKEIIKGDTKAMTKTIKIEGMMCTHCEAHVKNALETLDAVVNAEVSHDSGTALVTLSSDADDSALKSTVEAQGYKVLGIE